MTITLIILMLLVWVALGLSGPQAHKTCWKLPFLLPIIVGYIALAMLVWVATLGTRRLCLHVEDL